MESDNHEERRNFGVDVQEVLLVVLCSLSILAFCFIIHEDSLMIEHEIQQ